MGTIIKMTCKGCNQAWECYSGHGMQHGRLDNVLKMYPETVRKQVKELTAGECFPIYEFALQAANCPNCKTLVSVPVLDLKAHGTFVGQCPECGSEVKTHAVAQKLSCPNCGGQDWDLQDIGRWD